MTSATSSSSPKKSTHNYSTCRMLMIINTVSMLLIMNILHVNIMYNDIIFWDFKTAPKYPNIEWVWYPQHSHKSWGNEWQSTWQCNTIMQIVQDWWIVPHNAGMNHMLQYSPLILSYTDSQSQINMNVTNAMVLFIINKYCLACNFTACLRSLVINDLLICRSPL